MGDETMGKSPQRNVYKCAHGWHPRPCHHGCNDGAQRYDEETNLVTMEPEDIAQIVVSTLIDVAEIKGSKRFVKEAVLQCGLEDGITKDDAAITEMEYIVREALRSNGPFKDFADYKRSNR